MSTNRKVIEALYRAFKKKDYETFEQLCHEDIVWNQNPGFPKGSSYKGSKAVVENVFKSFDTSWQGWVFEIDNYYDAGDTIIVTGLYKGRYKETGKEFTSQAAHVYRLRDGKVVAFQQYADTKVICDVME